MLQYLQKNLRLDMLFNDRSVRSIIYILSDGMNACTLNVANTLLQVKEGGQSQWLKLYEKQKVTRLGWIQLL